MQCSLLLRISSMGSGALFLSRCERNNDINEEFCYGVSGVPERYLQELKVSFNLSR
jgi:hypothetical protein